MATIINTAETSADPFMKNISNQFISCI